MTDYRIYQRTIAGGAFFDGATVETATFSQERFNWTTTTTSVVGRWTPASLGRNNTASLVQVFSNTAAGPGDTVQVLSSTGAVRESATFQLSGSGWLLMMPDDILAVTSAASASATIFVNDLTDDQLAEYASAQAAAIAAATTTRTTVLTSAAAGVNVPAFSGIFIVEASNAAGAVNLPALSSVEPGDRVLVLNSGTGFINILPNGVDLINGLTSRTLYQGRAAWLVASTTGWDAVGGEVQPTFLTTGVDTVLSAWRDSPYGIETIGGAGQLITLPLAATVPIGAMAVLRNSSVDNHVLAANAADTIDGAANIGVNAGLTAIVIRVGTTSWYAVVA